MVNPHTQQSPLYFYFSFVKIQDVRDIYKNYAKLEIFKTQVLLLTN